MKIPVKLLKVEKGQVKTIVPISDVHLGHKYCNKTELKKRLQHAENVDARIVMLGDLFDGIVVKDPRYRNSQIDPEFAGKDDVLGSVLEMACEILEPYKDRIDFWVTGNHEDCVLKYGSFNLMTMILQMLYGKDYEKQVHFGYSGFFDYVLEDHNGSSRNFSVFATHGATGNAPVTKGAIEFNRVRTVIRADIYLLGHNHQTVSIPERIAQSNQQHVLEDITTRAMRCSTFLDMPFMHNGKEGMNYPEKKGMFPSVVTGIEFQIWLERVSGGSNNRYIRIIEEGKL